MPPSSASRAGAGRATGTADLPLHRGKVPPWLFHRMARLGRVIAEAIVLEYGRAELLRRLAHPFWFQAFGAVMGMDWHSSGITTSVVGALQRGLAPLEGELGLKVCGGRGQHSRETPGELVGFGERTGVDGAALARASRLVAKVDGAAVQDGHALYLHAFVVAADGTWAVVQQGMDPLRRRARRYHWLSEGLRSFVDEPHAAIEGRPGATIVNLTDRRAAPSREAQVALVHGGPDRIEAALRRARPEPHLELPGHHDVRASDLLPRRLHGALAAAAARGPVDFEELLLTPGVGARTVLSLALAAEVIHGAPCRFTDPARFSLAHGGKDGHPFPVPLRVYDETIRVLRTAVDRAKLGADDRSAAIRTLDAEARRLEAVATGPGVEAFIARERAASPAYGGRTVFDASGRPAAADPPRRGAPRPDAPASARTGQMAPGAAAPGGGALRARADAGARAGAGGVAGPGVVPERGRSRGGADAIAADRRRTGGDAANEGAPGVGSLDARRGRSAGDEGAGERGSGDAPVQLRLRLGR